LLLSTSEKILMSLNSKQKPLCKLSTAKLFPNETGSVATSDVLTFRSDVFKEITDV